MEAIALVQDWIQSVGSAAGLTQGNTNLLSGAIGASESRLEASHLFRFIHAHPSVHMVPFLRFMLITPFLYTVLIELYSSSKVFENARCT